MDLFHKRLEQAEKAGEIPAKYASLMRDFFTNYQKALLEAGKTVPVSIFAAYLELVLHQLKTPYPFAPYHAAVRTPQDLYQFGLDFVSPVIDLASSRVEGLENLTAIEKQIATGDNVILLANHQTEPDPQIISVLLGSKSPSLAENMIFVAGNRVVEDPLAVPFSMGRNLLCIHSKKHINNPPEKKEEKLLHNKRTMKIMGQLLAEGSKCIYVAPSGGRDRLGKNEHVELSPFDGSSIELFYLMSGSSGKPTHFYPLTLATYDLFPPPKTVEKELGEKRLVHYAPAHLKFGKEIDMEHFPGSAGVDKKEKRIARGAYIFELVQKDYQSLTEVT